MVVPKSALDVSNGWSEPCTERITRAEDAASAALADSTDSADSAAIKASSPCLIKETLFNRIYT